MDTRILDRQNYSPKTMENFEIMSAYYIDIFYNHLYNEAKKLKVSGSVSSITEGYKHTLNAFLKSLSNPNLYKKSLSGLHHYFITIGFASVSYAKCIDKITSEFVPTDYFNSLTFTQKIGVLRLVLNQSMKSFIKKLVDEHMSKIIDYHKDTDNVRLLQDEFIDCLILEREGFYQRFIASQTTTNKNETVNRLLAEKMQVEIKRLLKEKYDQKKQILILKKAYMMKKENENKLNEIIGELKNKIHRLEADNNDCNQYTRRTLEKPLEKPSENHVDLLRKKESTNISGLEYTEYRQGVNQQHLSKPSPQSTSSQSTSSQSTSSQSTLIQSNRYVKPHAETQNSKFSTPNTLHNEVSDDSDDEDSSFIEVNSSTIGSIIQGDNDILQNLRDSDMFNNTMDEGTTLDDFK